MKGNPSLETATVARVVSDEAQLQVARQNQCQHQNSSNQTRVGRSKVLYKPGEYRLSCFFLCVLHFDLSSICSSQQGTEFDFSVRFGGMAKSGG